MNTIQEQWVIFNKLVIPSDAPEIQRREMRRAFYAGAQALLGINIAISHPSISEDAGVQILEGCSQELQAFANDISKGRA